jgi:hypothetical protein
MISMFDDVRKRASVTENVRWCLKASTGDRKQALVTKLEHADTEMRYQCSMVFESEH